MELTQNNQPLVTVVIPLYNTEQYIAETIESVVSQTYKNWEMLIVDDCSTDNSRDVVRRYENKDNRIKLIESISNFGGPARPRNIGVENASGEYVAFLDADDLWMKEKLELQIAFMQENNLNFSSTDMQTINENNGNITVGNKFNNYLRRKAEKGTIEYLIRENYIATSSVILKRKVFTPFDESKEMIAVEDFCLWLKLFDSESVRYKYFDRKLIKYRVVESSISERGVAYKQEVKALVCILRFILESGKFKYIYPFSMRVLKKIYLRNKLERFI